MAITAIWHGRSHLHRLDEHDSQDNRADCDLQIMKAGTIAVAENVPEEATWNRGRWQQQVC